MPGLALGAFTGNRLGAVRDAKGKSVAAVFSELGNQQKAEVNHTPSLTNVLLILPLSADFTCLGNESSRFCLVALNVHVT